MKFHSEMYDVHSQVLGALQQNGLANTVIAKLHAKSMLYHMRELYRLKTEVIVPAIREHNPLAAEWCECTASDWCEHNDDEVYAVASRS